MRPASRCRRVLLLNSPVVSKIPSHNSGRLPSNIPLRTLGSRPDRDQQSTSLLTEHRHQPSRGRLSSDSADSDFSWSDTGDIAEQLADEEDPLRIKLADIAAGDEDGLLAGIHKRHPSRLKPKHVQFKSSVSDHGERRPGAHAGVVSKESIEIPDVAPRPNSRARRFIAAIMPGSSKFLL
ncbi:hypothetical protein DL764_002919 [Monosporascus ibericus]|uniref:Uncharacterized protein n=1 Tax=Monosporascus ibericus TaxID=155417 RepID=A0A4Q4TLU5_9PEZI|nr:hypothetical protein DL764_002919 [Monosporascus ibericus]